MLAGWLAVGLLVILLPRGTGGHGSGIGSLLPPNSQAVRVEKRSLELFRVPVLSETTVVINDPGGLSLLTRADAALFALSYTQAYANGRVPAGSGHIIAAVPVPVSTAASATTVTYLYTSSGTSLAESTDLARHYAAHFHNQPSVRTYVTGITPAQVAQADYLSARLDLFAIASLLLIAVVTAVTFRSPVTPVAVLAVAGFGYLLSRQLLGLAASAFGFALPSQIEPLIVALLLGVVTDYCVLFFSGFRRHLALGHDRDEAVYLTLEEDASVVAVAGLTVAGGTIALLAARLELFRAFGPALSLTVLVGVVVSLGLAPALMAILGPWVFWSPRRPPGDEQVDGVSRIAGRLVGRLIGRRNAAGAAAIIVGVLLLAAAPLVHLRFDMSFTGGLPADDPVSRGARVLAASGVRGVTAPTEVIVEGQGVARQRAALDRMQAALRRQPGVATVLGPAQNPVARGYGVVLAPTGDAARFVVVFDSDPLAAGAIARLRTLHSRLDGLARQSGLRGATLEVTGETAVASELATLTRENLRLTLLAALAVELALLVVYLRALVAPVVLLACSALSVAAALGLTTLVFQGLLGHPGLTFYGPFATAVLLIALGSDYNVFAVGAIWGEARHRPLADALRSAVPRSARAITSAGLILASTFALVAIIPLSTFRQIAFTTTVGLLIDTLLIRPVLTPAVLTLLGRRASWPSSRITVESIPDHATDLQEAT